MSFLSRRGRSAALIASIVGLASFVSMSGSAQADSSNEHGQVAPETPRVDTPVVLDGHVNASVQFGDLVVVGGEFSQVRIADGTVLDRDHLIAYDLDTGALDLSFDPVIDDEVLDLEVADDGSGLFIGGTFNTVDGETRRKLAKLDSSGELILGFSADADAKVQALDDDGVRLYFGGSFQTVAGEPRGRLAAVDITTGALSGFRNDVTGPIGLGGSGSVRSVDVHPDGNLLLVAHSSLQVDAQDRVGLAQIDLTSDLVTSWRTDWYAEAYERCADGGALTIRDAEYSPDGSYFVVVEKGHFECDKAIAFPTADGPGLEQNLWVTMMFDSTFSVGVTDSAVYVGGHFCQVRAMGPIDSSEARTFPWQNKPIECQSGGLPDDGELKGRNQIAALHPVTGEALPWNPGTNAFTGVFDIEPIERGLLIGQDRDEFGGVVTGRHSFLDYGPSLEGYHLLSSGGGVFTFGDVLDLGSVGLAPDQEAVAIATTPSGAGYLVVASDWTVTSFGDAPQFGPELENLGPGDTPVDIEIDRLGRGYWLFSANGAVVPVGDVPWFGDAGLLALDQPIVAATVAPLGDGYRLLAADGGVFSYGSSKFFGSIPQVLPGVALECPIVGIVDSGAAGYWLVGCDGGVFAFGDASFVGSLPGLGVVPISPVNGMVPFAAGYLLVAGDGGVFAFGGPFLGSLGDAQINTPIISISATDG